jgi:spore cortex formation protein SpoVR/YcgB (stage V sporulation)
MRQNKKCKRWKQNKRQNEKTKQDKTKPQKNLVSFLAKNYSN